MANLPNRSGLRRAVPPQDPDAAVGMLPVESESLQTALGLKLPEGASLAIVSPDLAMLKGMRAVSGTRFGALRTVYKRPSALGREVTDDVDTLEAFRPSARSLAILRGRQLAADDLKTAGGAFTLDQVRTMLGGVSRQAVSKRTRDGSLLSVPGPNNRRRFPAIQFALDGSVVRGLRRVREALETRNDWVLLNFLIQSDSRLNGRRPIDLLNEGAVEEVLASASRVGRQGS